MSEELIDKYIDRAAIKADTDFFLAEVQKILNGISAVGDIKTIKSTIQTANNPKAIAEAADLGVKANARLEQSIKAVKALVDQRFASEAKLITVATDYNKETVKNRLELQKQNKELKDQAKYTSANSGSIEQARAAVARLNTERNKLNLYTEEGRKKQAELNSQIDKYNNFIKKNVDSLSAQKINIGNYSGAVSILKKSFDEVVVKMDQMTKEGKNQGDVFDQLTKEYELLNKLVNSQEAGFANATAEIKANQRALIDLENAGLAGTQSFKQLEKATGELQDQLADLKARTMQLGSDTFVFDGLISAAEGLAGAYGAAQGVAALFGDENEDLQKTFVKLQAVMAVISSLQAIQNALQAESAGMLLLQDLRTKALAISQTIYGVAVGASTGAMKLFRIALLATGIGAIIGLLYLAADAMGVFGSSTSATTEELEAQAEKIEKNKQGLSDIADASEKARNRAKGGLNDLKRELELATARGESEEKLQKIKDEIYAKDYLNLNARFNTFKDFDDKQLDIAEENKDLSNKFMSDKAAYEKGKLDDIDKSRKEASDKEKARREKEAEANKKFREDERNATFDIFRSNAEERARVADGVSGDEKGSTKTRINALLDANGERQSILDAQKSKDLESVVAGSQQELLIVTKYGIDSNLLIEDFANKKSEIIKAAGQKDLAEYKKTFEDLTAASEKFYSIDTFKREEAKNAELLALTKQFANGEISSKELLEEKKKAVIDRYDKSELEAAIKHQLELLTIKSLSGQNVDAELEQLRALKLQANEIEIQDEQAKADKIAEIHAELVSKRKELAEAGKELFVSIVQGQFDKEKNLLEDQKIEAEKKAVRDIELVNASTLSEQDKAAKIIVINARVAAQKEQLERKQRALDVKKAQFDRVMSIVNIAQSTAEGIMKAVAKSPTTGGMPFTAIIAAIGAAQIAAILAKPIPKFRTGKGVYDNYEGPAIVGDGGKSEVIQRADGSIEFTPANDTLTYVGKNDIIHPDKDQWLHAILGAATRDSQTGMKTVQGAKQNEVAAALNKQTRLLEKIATKKELHLGAGDKGMVALWKWGANQVIYVDQNTNW